MSKYVYIYTYLHEKFRLRTDLYTVCGVFLDLLSIPHNVIIFHLVSIFHRCIYRNIYSRIQAEVFNMGLLRFFKSMSSQCLSDMVNNNLSIGKIFFLFLNKKFEIELKEIYIWVVIYRSAIS